MFENYPAYEHLIASVQLVLAMLGMGATLSAEDFIKIKRAPRSLVVGLLIQTLLVPILAIAVGLVMVLDTGIAIGLVLVAVVPGGALSNIAVYFGRGNATLSISLTTISTLACLVTAPFLLKLLISNYLPENFIMPAGQIAFDISVCLLIPLGLGMLAGWFLKEKKGVFVRVCLGLSIMAILVMVIGGATSGRIEAGAYGVRAGLSLVVMAIVCLQSALWISRFAGCPEYDRSAIGIEVTIRNINLALLIKASVFPAIAGVDDPIANQVFFAVLLYGGAQLLVGVPYLIFNARRIDRVSI